MKIIFLDIDGVLNNDHTKERFVNFIGVDARLRDMFLNWLKLHDHDIILSSSWRIPTAFGNFKEELKRNGIYWIDETPQLPGLGRGEEIEVCINRHNPKKYVILDDMGPTEFKKYQRPFLVQTSAIKGLEPKKLARMDQLLSD